MSLAEKRRRILGDLGKATKRGIRKCPQCGTLNGTRGLSCKNSLCDMVFKEIIEKPRRLNLEACKLITEQSSSSLNWTTIFSIRVKDRCPEYLRGFVQIEFDDLSRNEEATEPNPILLQLEGVLELSPIRGTCYVLGCNKRSQTAKLGSEEVCIHVLSCVSRSDYTEAKPFTLKHSVLNSMNLSDESKQKIFLTASEASGPLVQRVTSSTMVVKCDKDQLHPLGYLHTYFFKRNENSHSKFGCSCNLSLPNAKKKTVSIATINSPELHLSNTPVVKDRCLHFYSCLAAFSGDSSLSKEYSKFIAGKNISCPFLSNCFPNVSMLMAFR